MSKKNLIISGAALAIMAAAPAFAQDAVTTDVDWSKGSPRWTSSDGEFQFRIRGRYMGDAYTSKVDFDGTANDVSLSGYATRRLRLGVEGKMNSVFNFKAEVTFKPDTSLAGVEYNDVWLGYDNNGTEIIFGNNYFTAPLESLSSSLIQMSNERSMISAAFQQADRATGLVVRKYSDNWMVVGGYYGNKGEIKEAGNSTETQYLQIRGDYAISNEKGKYLIVGGHARFRDSNNTAISYSHAKAVQSNYGSGSYLGSPSGVLKDEVYGLEGFWSMGSMSFMAEYDVAKAKTATKEYDFGGGFVEAAYYFTGEVRSYDAKNGELKGVKPNSPLQEGGYGAWGVVARYDTLDMIDNGFIGGKANAYSIGAIWQPTDYVIFRAMYGRTDFEQTSKGAGKVDSFTLRTQFSF